MDDLKALVERAKALVPLCHCPYSKFRVTAVLEDSSGKLHNGVNIENASFGLSICAERVALASALASGAAGFERMVVHSPDGSPVPCGACRQVLSEFCAGDFRIIAAGPEGTIAEYRLADLLPGAFTLRGQHHADRPDG